MPFALSPTAPGAAAMDHDLSARMEQLRHGQAQWLTLFREAASQAQQFRAEIRRRREELLAERERWLAKLDQIQRDSARLLTDQRGGPGLIMEVRRRRRSLAAG